jgi:hypothetical protein
VAMLWDEDRGVVFRFPVGAKLFLVCKVSRPTHEPKQLPLYRVEGILSRGWSNWCLTSSFSGVKQYSYIPRPHVCLHMVHSDSFTLCKLTQC